MPKMKEIVVDYTKINFSTYKRKTSKEPIWKEIDDLSKKRNNAVHDATQFSYIEAKFALSLVKDLFDLITIKAFKRMGVKLNNNTIEAA